MNSKHSRWGTLIGVLFFIILLVAFAIFIDWQSVLMQLRDAEYWKLVVASLLLVAGYVAYAQRWRAMFAHKPSLAATFHAANAGSMANTLLPLRPGDAARIFLLGNKTSIPYVEVTSSIVVERWFEQIMRLAAFGGAIVFGVGMHVSALTLLGSLAFLLGSLVFMVWMIRNKTAILQKWPQQLARLPRISEESARSGLSSLIDGLAAMSTLHRLGSTLVWSIITWSLFWGFHYLCLSALHQELSIEAILGISLGSLALVPPSATTVPGIYQLSMVTPLVLVGYNSTLLTSYALIMNTIEMLIVNALGIWGAAAGGISLRQLFGRGNLTGQAQL